jgi:ubiquitin-like 1-activating enzyme E1 B
MDRYHALVQTFGQEHFEKVKNSHILVVGAGGIGCEILKNLVLSGFSSIEVIDLDTIDVSNLNRQFLFRPEHVGQPKAVVAAAAAKAFNPDVNIIAHYGNVKDTKFGIPYVSKFNVVLNALDNIDARRHVNRLCLGANVPLIDSGTTGYLGQVMPIFKGRTACYECMPKPTQKVYPICTIRSTPDKPVHCIVWAKECFKLLFGNTSESMLYEDPESGEQSTYMDLVSFPLELQKSPKGLVEHGCAILTALYSAEVEKKIDMGIYKTAKIAPKGINSVSVLNAGVRALYIIEKNAGCIQTSKVVIRCCFALLCYHLSVFFFYHY